MSSHSLFLSEEASASRCLSVLAGRPKLAVPLFSCTWTSRLTSMPCLQRDVCISQQVAGHHAIGNAHRGVGRHRRGSTADQAAQARIVRLCTKCYNCTCGISPNSASYIHSGVHRRRPGPERFTLSSPPICWSRFSL